jgi:hypothetical protein
VSIFPNNNNNRGGSASPIQSPFGGNDYAVGAAPGLAVNMNAVMRLVYVWMGLGLLVTTITALFISNTPALVEAIFANSGLLIGIVIAQFGLVIALSWAINKISPSVAGIMFLVYSATMGVTISLMMLVYTGASVVMAFGTTAAVFGAMTIFAFTTKMDLTKWRTFLFMGLIGLIIATLLNTFIFRSSGFDLMLSYFGVLLFTGLTAYDTYRIKQMAESPELAAAGGDAVLKLSIIGALTLYLDFINLFLFLLRILGVRRE